MKNKVKAYTLLATSLLALSPVTSFAEEAVGQGTIETEQVTPSEGTGIGGWGDFKAEDINAADYLQQDAVLTLEAYNVYDHIVNGKEFAGTPIGTALVAPAGISLSEVVNIHANIKDEIVVNGVAYYLLVPGQSFTSTPLLVKDYPEQGYAALEITVGAFVQSTAVTQPMYISADDYNKLLSGAASTGGTDAKLEEYSKETTTQDSGTETQSSEESTATKESAKEDTKKSEESTEAKENAKEETKKSEESTETKESSKEETSSSEDVTDTSKEAVSTTTESTSDIKEATNSKANVSNTPKATSESNVAKQEKTGFARLLPNTGDKIGFVAIIAGLIAVCTALGVILKRKAD